jgi:hypothetical protein
MQFLDTIRQRELELRRDQDDLERLKTRYPGYDFVPVAKPSEVTDIFTGETSTPLSVFDEAVLDTVNSQDQEWHSRSVMDAMRSAGKRISESDDAAMNAIAIALPLLTERGLIERVHVGRPHRYRRKVS